jgi:RHH-type proline utilization regulon transcriptional repressor/proline dehydrogenase/delta 1-pyrroline-5-carboxylate dehydrogenase
MLPHGRSLEYCIGKTCMDDFSPAELERIEQATQRIGRALFERLDTRRPGIWDRRWWDDRIMQWAMADESVKVQMFRFIDVLPMLRTNEAISRHLHEYFEEVRQKLPAAARLGLDVATRTRLGGFAAAIAARRNAMSHARRFIAGRDTREVLAAALRERRQKRAFTLDILGEAVTSEVEADRYLQAYLDLVTGIAPTVNSWPEVPQIDRDEQGPLPRVNVSVKLSALDSQFDPIDPEGTIERVSARLRLLLRLAVDYQAHVHIDMESYRTKDTTLAIFKSVMMEDEFRSNANVGIVIQCYLHDSGDDLIALRDWARQRGTPVWVRLVKGAYWDYETVHALSIAWPVPVYQEKWETDANFERQTRFVMRNHRWLRPAIGSHNLRSMAHGIAVAEHLGMPRTALELQMLYGMADAEKDALVELGHRMRIYMPYGELIPGMAYLVRRLLENTSNDSFLRASFMEQVSAEELLRNPLELAPPVNTEPAHTEQGDLPEIKAMDNTQSATSNFRNEPPADFNLEKNRRAMRDALADVRTQLDRSYPLVINNQPVESSSQLVVRSPANYEQTLGRVAMGEAKHVEMAVRAAREAQPEWAAFGAQKRAEYLRAAADVLRRRKFEIAAWEVLECGKQWRESDADVCEAIDFCEYYAAGAIALDEPQEVNVPGEENRFVHVPRGVTAVISPWNFPLAILTGMTTAALATGNTVVMKPAEQSSITAAKLMEVFQEVGVPAGVANYLPGRGEVVGAGLVDHPDVSLVVFTGSRAVGLAINKRAAEVSAGGLPYVKRVIAEMGGKNAIIVDADADLDEAVLGVMKSAFGYQGQKCSACSRAIVLDSVYDAFLTRLVEAARSLKVGPAADPATSVGPVIDRESVERIRRYIELGRKEAREVLAVDVGELAKRGNFIGPHIFADVKPTSRLAQEEIFGPVLAVIRAKDLTEAIAIANGTEYALTGGIFSRSPANLDRAAREMQVGNLYLNRSITGALVGRQPFGGFKMSGIGSKAGGPDYLLQFVLPKTITENTLRRGFAPPAQSEVTPATTVGE